MPRRGVEPGPLVEPPKKRTRLVTPEPSLDVSFYDDEGLKPGIILSDLAQKKWRIGKPIGRGSFGRIYLASDDIGTEVTKENAHYVVKIEPHTNGPLFVEIHCLIRTAQPSAIQEWRLKNKDKSLGMPAYIASGSFIDPNTKIRYRFLVLPRYEIDLHKIIQKRGKVLDLKNVLVLTIQILDVLEFLHEKGYTHSDIKSSNLMIGFDREQTEKQINVVEFKTPPVKKPKKLSNNYYVDEDFIVKDSPKLGRHKTRHFAFNLRQLSSDVNYEDFNSVCSDESFDLIDTSHSTITQSSGQIYLLDYGLASKFIDSSGLHKEFAMDARRAHDGTLEYSSRDSHIGAHSRRSDLETLGFNILDWLTGTLPWKNSDMLEEPDLVHCLKKNYMADVNSLLKTCFKTELYPKFIENYLEYVKSLDFTQKPDYNYCRNIFKSEFQKNSYGTEKNMILNLKSLTIKKNLNIKKFRRNPIKNSSADFIQRNGIKKICERENISSQSLENELKMQLLKRALNSSNDSLRKPCTSKNFYTSESDLIARLKKSLLPLESFGRKISPKNLRSKKRVLQKKRGKKNSIGKFGSYIGFNRPVSWAEVLALNPEKMAKNDDVEIPKRGRKISNASETSVDCNTQSPLLQKDYLTNLNPTYAMKDVISNFKKKVAGKNCNTNDQNLTEFEGFTPIMVKMIKIKEKRLAKERQQEEKEKEVKDKKDKDKEVKDKKEKDKKEKEAERKSKETSELKSKSFKDKKESPKGKKDEKLKQKDVKIKIETRSQNKKTIKLSDKQPHALINKVGYAKKLINEKKYQNLKNYKEIRILEKKSQEENIKNKQKRKSTPIIPNRRSLRSSKRNRK